MPAGVPASRVNSRSRKRGWRRQDRLQAGGIRRGQRVAGRVHDAEVGVHGPRSPGERPRDRRSRDRRPRGRVERSTNRCEPQRGRPGTIVQNADEPSDLRRRLEVIAGEVQLGPAAQADGILRLIRRGRLPRRRSGSRRPIGRSRDGWSTGSRRPRRPGAAASPRTARPDGRVVDLVGQPDRRGATRPLRRSRSRCRRPRRRSTARERRPSRPARAPCRPSRVVLVPEKIVSEPGLTSAPGQPIQGVRTRCWRLPILSGSSFERDPADDVDVPARTGLPALPGQVEATVGRERSSRSGPRRPPA